MGFDLSRYLDRIGLTDASPGAEGLLRLQQAQIRAIPFEAVDPVLGRVPALSLDAIHAKIADGRGGYCFELNLLFEAALIALGFQPRRVMGRVRLRADADGRRSHLALLVPVEGRIFLADCGFGGPGTLDPLDVHGGEQMTANGRFRISEDAEHGEMVLERLNGGEWQPLYSFDQSRVTMDDIVAANHVCATMPGSPFVGNLMVGGWRGDRRLTLLDRTFGDYGPDGEVRRELADQRELAAALAEIGLTVTATDREALWRRLAG